MEAVMGAATGDYTGVQSFRLETRYLDPSVNAFVGMLGSFSRFNQKLSVGVEDSIATAHFVSNWGIDMGIVRGRHVWALDLMGSSIGSHLAFSPAFVGEHAFNDRWSLFHRTTVDLFTKDTVYDLDQGIVWKPWKSVGLSLGYRIFTGKHMSRNGPRAGLIWHFESPRLPFIFPSLG